MNFLKKNKQNIIVFIFVLIFIIFFDNKGTILKFDASSKLKWQKNIYSKSEKKLNPVLQFANNKKNLIIADNIAKYYMLDINNGNLIWTRNNSAPFNSQIKIFEDKEMKIQNQKLVFYREDIGN